MQLISQYGYPFLKKFKHSKIQNLPLTSQKTAFRIPRIFLDSTYIWGMGWLLS